jgi:hypothetical protein
VLIQINCCCHACASQSPLIPRAGLAGTQAGGSSDKGLEVGMRPRSWGSPSTFRLLPKGLDSLSRPLLRTTCVYLGARVGVEECLHELAAHFLSASIMRSTPRSLYARQYLVGAHATASHGPAVLNVWTCSPVSVWVTSNPEPKRGTSKQTSFVSDAKPFPPYLLRTHRRRNCRRKKSLFLDQH